MIATQKFCSPAFVGRRPTTATSARSQQRQVSYFPASVGRRPTTAISASNQQKQCQRGASKSKAPILLLPPLLVADQQQQRQRGASKSKAPILLLPPLLVADQQQQFQRATNKSNVSEEPAKARRLFYYCFKQIAFCIICCSTPPGLVIHRPFFNPFPPLLVPAIVGRRPTKAMSVSDQQKQCRSATNKGKKKVSEQPTKAKATNKGNVGQRPTKAMSVSDQQKQCRSATNKSNVGQRPTKAMSVSDQQRQCWSATNKGKSDQQKQCRSATNKGNVGQRPTKAKRKSVSNQQKQVNYYNHIINNRLYH